MTYWKILKGNLFFRLSCEPESVQHPSGGSSFGRRRGNGRGSDGGDRVESTQYLPRSTSTSAVQRQPLSVYYIVTLPYDLCSHINDTQLDSTSTSLCLLK